MKEIYTALINAQKEIKNPPRDTQGYGYKYTDLATMVNELKPILFKNGLTVVQLLSDSKLVTKLIHTSGECIESSADIPILSGGKMNDVQAMGASITYMRRYAISALFFVASEDDTDGVVSKPITAKEHSLSYALDTIEGCQTLEQLDNVRFELSKKKNWSKDDIDDIKNAVDTRKKELAK